MTVEQILEALGGFAKVAKATGTPITTVHSWKRVGFIPEWRRPGLIALAAKAGVALVDADFPSYRPATRQSGAAA